MEANSEQQTAFLNATGVQMGDVLLLATSLVAIVILLWGAWVAFSNYEQWAQRKGDVSLYDVMWTATRVGIVISIIIYVVN